MTAESLGRFPTDSMEYPIDMFFPAEPIGACCDPGKLIPESPPGPPNPPVKSFLLGVTFAGEPSPLKGEGGAPELPPLPSPAKKLPDVATQA